MTNYEKYQLQWMIDHDVSIENFITDMCEFADEELASVGQCMCGSWSTGIYESYEAILNETGFSNGMCFVCEAEWNQNEREEM